MTKFFILAAAAAIIAAGFVHPAAADGAIAVGVAPGGAQNGLAYGRSNNQPTADAAGQEALQLCRTSRNANDAARNQCTLVSSYHRQCTAFSMDPADGTPGAGWAIAPTAEAAQKQALANCEATAGPNRRGQCVLRSWACDGQ